MEIYAKTSSNTKQVTILAISKVLLFIISFLTDLNPDDPLIPEIVQLNKKDINS